MDKKIMIVGASGTGKTTMANHVGALNLLPLMDTSAKHIWPKFGFTDHADAIEKCNADYHLSFKYQWEILHRRYEQVKTSGPFICDRSFIDNAAYILMSLGGLLCHSDMESLLEICRRGMEQIDGLIFLRFNDQTQMVNDGKRITSHYYQAMVDAVMKLIITSDVFGIHSTGKVLELGMWDFDTRIDITQKWLKNL